MNKLESKFFLIVTFLKLCCFYFIVTELSNKTWPIDNLDPMLSFLSSHYFLEVVFRVLALSIATCLYSFIALIPAGIISLIIEKYTKRELNPEYFILIAIIFSCLFLTYTFRLITYVELYLCYLVFLPYEKIKIKWIIYKNKATCVLWGIAALIIVFLVMAFKYLDSIYFYDGDSMEKLKSISGKNDTHVSGNSIGDDVSLLYERLLSKGYEVNDIGTEEVFRNKLSEKNNRIELYNYIKSREDFNIGSYTDYDKRISACYNKSKAYICTGKSSKTYHKIKSCKGLNRCSKQVKEVSLEEAKRIGRRECKLCY